MIVALVVDTFKWSLHAIPLDRNAAAEAVVCDRVASFWRNHLDTGIQPPVDPERDEQIIKALFPNDNGIEIDLSHDNEMPGLVYSLETARAAKKAAESDEKVAKTAIAGKMGAAAIARLADGRRLSFKTQHRDSYVVGESDFRVMRILKGKG